MIPGPLLRTLPYAAPFLTAILFILTTSSELTTLPAVAIVVALELLPLIALFGGWPIDPDHVKLFHMAVNALLVVALLLFVDVRSSLAVVLSFWLPLIAYFAVLSIWTSIDRIDDGLFVGNFQAGRDSALLKAHCITHVLELHDGRRMNDKNASVEHRQILFRPTDDLATVVDEAVDFIHGSVSRGGIVLVHCSAGVSRSPIIAAAYLMRHRGYSRSDALAKVCRQRVVVDPSLHFMKRLGDI